MRESRYNLQLTSIVKKSWRRIQDYPNIASKLETYGHQSEVLTVQFSTELMH